MDTAWVGDVGCLGGPLSPPTGHKGVTIDFALPHTSETLAPRGGALGRLAGEAPDSLTQHRFTGRSSGDGPGAIDCASPNSYLPPPSNVVSNTSSPGGLHDLVREDVYILPPWPPAKGKKRPQSRRCSPKKPSKKIDTVKCT